MQRLSLLSILFLISCAVFSQNNSKSVRDTLEIEEVVVTGTKASVNRNQVHLTVSIIKPEVIEYSTETSVLPVLSEQVPGLFVTERGITGFGVSDGAAGQISIRGLGGSPTTQVLILVNGNPQYMGIMGHPLADAYRSSSIERVEIIRGPASTLYGSNAMGGVINIITKEQHTEGISAHAGLSFGSFNTFKAASGIGYKNQGFSIVGGINHDQTDGHREASYFSITDGYARLGYEFNKHYNSTIDLSLAQFNGADPGLDTAEIIELGDTLDILRGMGAFAFNNKFDKADGSFRLFYNFGDHEISTGFKSNDYNYGIVLYENFHLLTGNTLTLGFDYKTYGGKADLTKYMNGLGLTLVDTAMNEIAGYATVQQNLWGKLTINAGLRADHHSEFGTELVPTGGIAYHPFTNTTFKGSVSKGFRSPTIRELFIQFPGGAPAPNNELNPESVINTELSVQQKLLNNKLEGELAFFHIDAKNLINVGMDNGTLTYLNSGETKNTGVEIGLNYAPVPIVLFNSNYTYIKMETPITGTPEQKFYLGLTFMPKKWDFSTSVMQISNLSTGNSTETYTLWNSRVGYHFIFGLTIFLKADNLLNENYQINYGYPMPGTTFLAGLNFHLH